MIQSSELHFQERGLQLHTRAQHAGATTPVPVTGIDQLQVLRGRIDAARNLKPAGHDLHCEDCWCRGRDAAIRAIEGT